MCDNEWFPNSSISVHQISPPIKGWQIVKLCKYSYTIVYAICHYLIQFLWVFLFYVSGVTTTVPTKPFSIENNSVTEMVCRIVNMVTLKIKLAQPFIREKFAIFGDIVRGVTFCKVTPLTPNLKTILFICIKSRQTNILWNSMIIYFQLCIFTHRCSVNDCKHYHIILLNSTILSVVLPILSVVLPR